MDGNAALGLEEQDNFWKDVKTDGGILNEVLGGDAPVDGGDGGDAPVDGGDGGDVPVDGGDGGDGGDTGVNAWNTLKAIMNVNGDGEVSNEEFVNFVKNMVGTDLSQKLSCPTWKWEEDPYVLTDFLSGGFNSCEGGC